jgi:hypothetical protein
MVTVLGWPTIFTQHFSLEELEQAIPKQAFQVGKRIVGCDDYLRKQDFLFWRVKKLLLLCPLRENSNIGKHGSQHNTQPRHPHYLSLSSFLKHKQKGTWKRKILMTNKNTWVSAQCHSWSWVGVGLPFTLPLLDILSVIFLSSISSCSLSTSADSTAWRAWMSIRL